METSQQQMQVKLLTTLGLSEASVASHFPLQEFAKVLRIKLGEQFSLTSLELSRLNNLKLWSWRTSEGWSVTPKGKLSPLSSIRWENWATTQNGVCLTARITESPITECDGIVLQDILEQNPAEQFFLSDRVTKKILGEQGSICHIA